jgi:hypothetical protein
MKPGVTGSCAECGASLMVNERLKQAAGTLARQNAESDPAIEEIYLFPAANQIRLVEIDSSVAPSDQIEPFYFGADPGNGLEYASAIALIRPEERGTLPPPTGWGDWNEAERIWPETSRNGK